MSKSDVTLADGAVQKSDHRLMTPSPEAVSKNDQAAKAKSEERKAQLDAFRAAQAAKKAASLGQKSQQAVTAPAKAPNSRVPASLKAEQKDPNMHLNTKKASSLSPDRKPAATKQDLRPKSGPTMKAKGTLLPPKGKAQLKGQAAKDTKAKHIPDTTESKQPAWLEAQHAFGFETSQPMESRRTTQAGEPSSSSLGAGFGDDGDPNVGIRWQIQLEKLRLQQWQILNKRVTIAREAQRKQAEMQISQAAAAVAGVKDQVCRANVCLAKQRNAQHAAEALAAQMPRLELYSSMKEEHEAQMEKITTAVAAALQQMPLVNGTVCGSSPESTDVSATCRTLQDIRSTLDSLSPRVKPFLSKPKEEAGNKGPGGLHGTAQAAAALACVDGELRDKLQGNSALLTKVERELVHAEALAVQLLMCKAGE